MTYTVGSLFAGIGGIDLGFERAGFKTVWQVEQNEYCRKVLAKNFPHADRSVTDVRDAGKHNLKPVDVIVGGFPCQDISNAGLRAGISGERSGLWSEYARIIRELRPKYVLVENVAALLGRGMGRVLGDLAEIGYDAEWEIISAADVGAPHLRERVWIVSYPKGQRFSKARGFQHPSTPERIPRSGETRIFADAWEERIQRRGKAKIQGINTFSWCKNVRRIEDLRGRPDIPEPLFRGSRDGVPNWVDRISALGNAVVPEIPYQIALRIKAALEAA